MCCETARYRETRHGRIGDGRCCELGFWTKEEKVEWLERRLEELTEEAETIKRRMAALKTEK